MTDTTDIGELPKARVHCHVHSTDIEWFYSIEREDPVGPFLSATEAGAACRGERVARAEKAREAQS